MRLLPVVLLSLSPLMAAAQEEDYPKLGPNAVSLTDDHGYLQSSPAPDYWAYASFVKPQFTTSACSVAAITAAMNGLKGLPQMASETVMTQQELLDLAADEDWARVSAEGGDGVTFAQLEAFTGEALAATGQDGMVVHTFHPAAADEAAVAEAREILTANEAGAEDVALVYYNQGVVTGDWDGPHVAVVGAYDAAQDRVLILEVDQEWYVPYWTPLPVLVEAMVKPTSAEHGILEGETGGLVVVRPG